MKSFAPPALRRRAVAPLFFVVAVIVFGAVSAAAQTSVETANRQLKLWQDFSPDGFGFKILVPKPPDEIKALSAETEKMKTKSFEVAASGGKYRITAIRLAKPSPDFEEAKEIAEQLIEQMPNGSGAGIVGNTFVVTSKAIVKPDVIEGFIVMEKDGARITVKTFTTRTGVYILNLETPVLYNVPRQIKEIYQAESDKFFNSFQISDDKKQR